VFPLHQIADIRPWNYFRRIPTYFNTVPDRYGQTDGRTTYCRITALCASIAR